MHTKRIVVIGTSAGGIEALRTLVAALPADFPAAIGIVLHMAPQSPDLLHEILDRAGPLPVHQPRNNERILAGHVYVAPPDCHLLIEPGVLRVTKGPKENRFRPAVDPLFRSAAQIFGPAAIGVVLTGNLDDGTAGLWTIKQLGGVAIVQDPDDALFPSMPRSAQQHTRVDYSVPLVDIAPLLVRLTATAAVPSGEFTVPERVNIEVNIAKEHNAVDAGVESVGEPSSFA
jgi:two-component system chemotaxis response regulator CheB